MPPTHKPMEISFPPKLYFLRSSSHANIRILALSNCWSVKSRSVYRIITVTPSAFASRSLRKKITKAVIPKYASVLPPPVGNHSRSTICRSGMSCPGCPFGSIKEVSSCNKNANWKGYQLTLSGLKDFPFLSSVCLRWSNIASLASWKARNAFPSPDALSFSSLMA